jgi:hypothetical protein
MFKKIISENKTSLVALSVSLLTLMPIWSTFLKYLGMTNADSKVDTSVWAVIVAIALGLWNHRTYITIKYEGDNIDEESEIIISLKNGLPRTFKIIFNAKKISKWGSRKKIMFTFPKNISLSGNTKYDDLLIQDNTINIPLNVISKGETTFEYAINLLEDHPSGSKQFIKLSDNFRLKSIKSDNKLKIVWR